MPRTVVNLVAMAGVMSWMGASSLSGQQQVQVTVAAVTNPIPPGSCTRIVTDVRDELNRQLTLENGVPLQWGSYDYTSSNGVDFEWRGTGSGEFELCAKPGAGAASTQVTATIKGMSYNGSTVVAVAAPAPAGVPGQPNVAPPTAHPAQAAAAAGAAGAPQGAAPPPVQAPTAAAGAAAGAAGAAPAAGGSAQAAGASAPAPTASAPAAAGPAAGAAGSAAVAAGSAPGAAAPTQGYAPPPAQAYSPPAGAAPAAGPAAAPPQQAQAKPVKSAGGFFKKIGSHIKQKAAEVKTETTQNLTLAATQVVDTAFQTGSRLVASTTAEVSNTARMGIGGVGQKLMLAPQRGGGSADNLALAVGSGRAVLLEMRFTPGTDVLEPAARELARRLAEELKKAMATIPGSRFVIEAHVDPVPNAQVLSEYRAAAVKAALTGNGVDAARLIALGYGTSRPLEPGSPPAARIEIVRVQ